MTYRSVIGAMGLGALLVLGGCAILPETAMQTQPDPAPPESTATSAEAATSPDCEPLPGVHAEVADARPVYYGGPFDPNYMAVTDTSLIQEGAGQPNAVQYYVVTNDGRQVPLITQELYSRGDRLFIETDTCDRARVTVTDELG